MNSAADFYSFPFEMEMYCSRRPRNLAFLRRLHNETCSESTVLRFIHWFMVVLCSFFGGRISAKRNQITRSWLFDLQTIFNKIKVSSSSNAMKCIRPFCGLWATNNFLSMTFPWHCFVNCKMTPTKTHSLSERTSIFFFSYCLGRPRTCYIVFTSFQTNNHFSPTLPPIKQIVSLFLKPQIELLGFASIVYMK